MGGTSEDGWEYRSIVFGLSPIGLAAIGAFIFCIGSWYLLIKLSVRLAHSFL
ncbi:hypothetical protein HYV30_00095 [Candidatus Kaiserbacteria bacterium]|nr:hypothetical protein [Candidatus Kaiserbacteria bacterium]